MSKRRPPAVVTEDDATLFRDAIDRVRPLDVPPPPPRKPPPAPEPRSRARDEAEALAASRSPAWAEATADAAEALSYRRDEVPASVLKALVDRLLRQRADVLAFASAPDAMGGTGAVLALLAPRRPGEQRVSRD